MTPTRMMLLILTCASTVACSHAPARDRPEGSESPLPQRLLAHRTAIRQMRAHPGAAEIAKDLDQAEAWLARADRTNVGGSRRDGRLDLGLTALEGQLAEANARLARGDAEQELEEARKRYASLARKVEAPRTRTRTEAALDSGRNDK